MNTLSGIDLSQKGPIGDFRDLLGENVLQIGVRDGSRDDQIALLKNF